MLSAFILSIHSYPAMTLADQLVHHWYVHSGLLILGAAPFKFPRPTTDRDRTVSRRSEPSSRTTLMDEQSNPWKLLHLPLEASPPPRCRLITSWRRRSFHG